MTDKYGNEVTQLARPLPVEYLLVDLPAAFPVDLALTFYADPNVRSFAMAHRGDIVLTRQRDNWGCLII